MVASDFVDLVSSLQDSERLSLSMLQDLDISKTALLPFLCIRRKPDRNSNLSMPL